MKKSDRILIIYSINDKISRKRLIKMRASPVLASFRFEQCFALLNKDEDLTPYELFERVSKAIESYGPTILLIHTGLAYHRHLEAYVSAIRMLKEKFTHIRFGYEDRKIHGSKSGPLLESGAIEQSPEMHELQALFFERVFGFE